MWGCVRFFRWIETNGKLVKTFRFFFVAVNIENIYFKRQIQALSATNNIPCDDYECKSNTVSKIMKKTVSGKLV